jgi:hemoglobin
MQTVYEAAGGHDGLLRLASAWHARVLGDEVVSHAFSHGFHPQHTERLAAYWAEALGGPTTYSDVYGDETSVVRIHSGNGPHDEMDRRAIACFDQALQDVGLARDERLDGFCTIISPGLPRRRWLVTMARLRMCRMGCVSQSGPGTASSARRRRKSERICRDCGVAAAAHAPAPFHRQK